MTPRIKTIIVEDEPLAREGLLMFIKEVEFLDVVAECEDALEANDTLTSQKVDLMFLDIQMPKLTGIDFLKSLADPPMAILTTAYPNFALQGYELNVIDYLVKPFPFDRFLKAANKARDFYLLRSKNDTDPENIPDYFFVKVDYRYEKIHFGDILYVEAMENYLTIHTKDQKYMTLLRMKSLEAMLPETGFIRIHKSYIVAVRAIQSIDGNEIVVSGKRLPLSRDRRTDILEKLVKKQ